MTEQEIRAIVERCTNRSQVYRELGWHSNGTSYRKLHQLIEKYDIDISHFNQSAHKIKWPIVTKICPVCDKQFETQLGHPKEKTTCSYSCSNTLFRSGENNPNWKHPEDRTGVPEYRRICSQIHEPKCLICGWDISVDAHHIDREHSNNDISNLCFLCPNHHRMAHMTEHQEEIDDRIQQLLKPVSK